jgi:hypothetical protein
LSDQGDTYAVFLQKWREYGSVSGDDFSENIKIAADKRKREDFKKTIDMIDMLCYNVSML